MITKPISLIFPILISITLCAQESLTVHDDVFLDIKNEKAYAQKHQIEKVSQYVFKNPEKKDSTLLFRTDYDQASYNILKQVRYSFDNPKDSTVDHYQYDGQNRISEISTSYADGYVSMYKFRFYDEGERVELFYDFGYKSELELVKYTYSFYEDGRIKGKQFDVALFSNIYYNYNDKNQLLNVSYVINDTSEDYAYDAKGNNVLRKGSKGEKVVFKYNDQGNVIERYFQDEYGQIKDHIKKSYQYDANNNPIEISVFSGNGKLKYKSTIEYNKKNLPVKEINYDKKGKANRVYQYHYKYTE